MAADGTVGLQPGGTLNPLGKPDLEGEVNGHEVRVRTYTMNRKHSNDRRYTVVEAALREPVEWSAIVSPDPDVTAAGASAGIGLNDEAAGLQELDSIHAVTVDVEFAVVGELGTKPASSSPPRYGRHSRRSVRRCRSATRSR